MHLTHFPAMVLFSTSIQHLKDEGKATVGVCYKNDHGDCLHVPLNPKSIDLRELEINMYNSPTKAYDMGTRYNAWFSERFGYDVILVFLGENSREVLGNLSPKSMFSQQRLSAWLPTFFDNMQGADEGITFADCAPYLIVSETSMGNVNRRLPEGDKINITQFRPNIVIGGAATEFEEDFWAELSVGTDLRLILTQNCARCRSLNIGYRTGEPGKTASGKVLQSLMKDRRVDAGTKYSPIFGRYGFLASTPSKANALVNVGSQVKVLRRNQERTKFGELLFLVHVDSFWLIKSRRMAWHWLNPVILVLKGGRRMFISDFRSAHYTRRLVDPIQSF